MKNNAPEGNLAGRDRQSEIAAELSKDPKSRNATARKGRP